MHFSGLCIIGVFALANAFSISNRVITLYKKNEIRQIKEFEPLFETDPKAKVVVSTPGGLFGFYFMGISAYIKENYNLENYIFTGASAGSWNSLFLSLNDDPFVFKKKILKTASKSKKSIYELEQNIKSEILKNYNESSFDLEKIYLGVSVLDRSEFKLCVYNDFDDLEDALDCCIASSHIPFVTGGAFNNYRNKLSFDGGFYNYPCFNVSVPSLIIAPDIWSNNTCLNVTVINCNFDTFFNLKKIPMDLSELFDAGYEDSKRNKEYLDKIFVH